MRYAPEPSSGFRRMAAIAAALVAWGFTGLILLAALVWGTLLRCDESCGGDSWRHTNDAWQWHAVTALGVAAFACGAALVYFVWKGRRLRAAVAVGLGLAGALALATAMSPDWVFHLDRRTAADLAVVAVGIGAPLVSVAFTAPRAETSGP
jgi:uncharacterized BrkB/YihY/UPF0761 family membrane protein